VKFNRDLVFGICLVVACGFRESFKDTAVNKLRKLGVLFQGECITNFCFIDGQCREMESKIEKVS